jgi:hypothetical protein
MNSTISANINPMAITTIQPTSPMARHPRFYLGAKKPARRKPPGQ